MQYIVLDLEWNQALTGEMIRRRGFKLAGEIIQIGAVRLGEDLSIGDTLRILVSPKYYKKMHWSVRKLTGISTKSLEDGLPFPQAYAQFMEWCGPDCTFLTWGPDDIPMLKTNLCLHKMETDGVPPSFDLQRMYGRVMHGERRQYALADALAQLEITETFPAHDALNDALNTARICQHFPLEEAILHYNDPLPKKEKSSPTLSEDAIHYESTSAMMEDALSEAVTCPHCAAPLSFGKWIRRAPGKRITLAICPCGEARMLKLHWKNNEELGGVDAVRVLTTPSDTQKEAYQRALAHRRRKHRKAGKNAPEAQA